jgi:hypothetical protein
MKIKNIICTCNTCPSQWEAKSEDGRPVFIHYRWGELNIGIGEPGELIDKAVQKSIFNPAVSIELGGEFDGDISLEKVMPYIEGIPEVTP